MRFSFRKWLEAADNPQIQWRNDVPTYHRGLVRANQLRPGFVHVYDPSHYGIGGRRVFHDEHGEIGYSLLPQESPLQTPGNQGKIEIAGVYNHGGHRKRGWGVHAIHHAARQGGDYLEAFEGNDKFSLPAYYHRHLGAMPVGYLPWDDQYAPKGWDYEANGRPGVVQLAIPEHGKADLDSWLSKNHTQDPRSIRAFQELLRHYKRMAGVKMEENKKHDPKKHRDHSCSFDDFNRLADGVDEFYFGAGDAVPMPEPDDKIGRFIHMKAHEWNVSITEAAQRSMARLYGQIANNEKTVIILTAFRHENDLKTNRQLNVSLGADLRKLGWGYTPVMGGFVEKGEGGKDVHVQEESLFVNATGDPGQVVSTVHELLKKYQQQAALVKLPDDPVAVLLWDDGHTTPAGQWHADPQQMAQYYTQMRSGPPGRQFKFEAAGDDSVMTRMAVENFFKNQK
jgi:hypothetical protein